MSYNWKCCSFYPNNFDASALEMNHIVIVPRPRYMRTPTEVHAYPDRGTCVPRPRYDDFKIRFTLHSSFPEDFFSKARTYIPCASES